MRVKIGEIVKARVEAVGISKAELARRLHMSPANVHKIFKRDSIDSALLHTLGVILNCDFFIHFKIEQQESTPRTYDNEPIEVLMIKYMVDLESRVRILEERWQQFRDSGKVEEALEMPYYLAGRQLVRPPDI